MVSKSLCGSRSLNLWVVISINYTGWTCSGIKFTMNEYNRIFFMRVLRTDIREFKHENWKRKMVFVIFFLKRRVFPLDCLRVIFGIPAVFGIVISFMDNSFVILKTFCFVMLQCCPFIVSLNYSICIHATLGLKGLPLRKRFFAKLLHS